MTAEEATDCIDRIRSGETEAYAEIVRAFHGEAWKVAAAMLRNVSETENLVQQAFVDAFLKLDSFRAGEDFGAWIRAIVRNRVRQDLRTRAREDRRLEVYRQHAEQRLDDDAAADARDAQTQAALRHCRESLGDEARRALALRYDAHLPLEEVAQKIGKSVEACQKMLSRLRASLRACIEKRMEGT